MGVLDDTSKQARLIAAKLKVSVESKEKVFLRRRRELQAKFNTQLALFVDNYKKDRDASDAARTALDNLHENATTLTEDVRYSTRYIQKQMASVDQMVTGLQATLSKIQTTEFDDLDATSKELLLDFSKEYKGAYAILWAKIALVAFLVYFLREHWILFSVAYLAVYVAWAVVAALIEIFKNIFKKKSIDLKAAKCANVTAADAIGSECEQPEAPTYKPCSSTDFGCCANGLPAPSDKSTCGTLDCWKTAFGCCPNGNPRKSATDKCNAVPHCKTSKFGCCLNGMPRDDAMGSNCTLHSSCGYTAFGCCPDGVPRADAAGSNCKGAKETPLSQVNELTLSLDVPKLPTTPNPFTDSGFGGFASGFQAVA